MPKILKFLIGLIIFLVFGYFYTYKKAPEIEEMVRSRVYENLSAEGIEYNTEESDLSVDVDGFDVKVSGSVANDEIKNNVINACSTCGKNKVDTTELDVGDWSKVNLKASYDGSNSVVLNGSVPSESIKSKIFEKATSLFGEGNVLNKLTVLGFEGKKGEIFSFAALSAIPFLKNFLGNSTAYVDLTKTIFTGLFENEGLEAQVRSKFSSGVPDNYTVKVPKYIKPLKQDDCQGEINELMGQNKIRFESSKSIISSESFTLLGDIKTILEKCTYLNIRIEGHTDASGKRGKNEILSRERAGAVKTKLMSLGLSADRIETVGLGQDAPIATNKTISGRAKNRRIEFKILGEK